MPNADTDNKILFDMIKRFVDKNENACVFSSLGQLLYFSFVDQVDLVIGNSSSGLLEVPTFKKPTINIGDRQSGRIKATSVVDCMSNFDDINYAIDRACSSEFKKIARDTINPYGAGGAVEKILQVLEGINLTGVLKKQFHDLDVN
jgi:GDP/UDP-N,N'-diacetylbacillosamine 2-epimerase (hydrolysing)